MIAKTVLCMSALLAIYHHAAYPFFLKLFARRAKGEQQGEATALSAPAPSIQVIVPAHNEAHFIAQKIANLAALQYPGELSITVICDGCADDTASLAQAAATQHRSAPIEVIVHQVNRGKVAVLNEAIAQSRAELVALSDASAMLPADALTKAAAHFNRPKVGFVCGRYEVAAGASEAEKAYWRYQCAVKTAEAVLGSPFGAHGAFYVIRRDACEAMPPDTINDDVILPMTAVSHGYQGVYDADIAVREAEANERALDFRRRMRLGAGNLQQMIRLWRLADPRRPGIAFTYLSGKALRSLMPFLLVAGAAAVIALAAAGNAVFKVLALLSLAFAPLCFVLEEALPKPLALASMIARGYAAALIGSLGYLLRGQKRAWARVAAHGAAKGAEAMAFIPWSVTVSKRAFDIICGLGALMVLAVLYVPLAIAIKLGSPGPVFYRQLRVGRMTPEFTELFWLIKFRTMRQDAEAKSGPVWAKENDPRITKLGRFMRKTRLDELPQCINVLRGEMSVVGPRPERPAFFRKLETEIPFYTERTFGLRPGITGLAQVNQPYDQTIEDVRNKVLFDHAYAARLFNWRHWLLADLAIIAKTATVMVTGKGAR